MEKTFEKVATSNAKIDEMVNNYINDFYGKPEDELNLSDVMRYYKLVKQLNTTTHRDFENDLLAIMTANLYYISGYLTTLFNWDIFPMADDDDLKREFENRLSDYLHHIKSAIKTYVTKRDKMFN